jgi:hypothetical protein
MKSQIPIRKPKGFKKKKISCQICDTVLKSFLDFSSSDNFDCCETCRVKWVESRKEDYLSGWRPSEEEVLREINKRNSLPLSFTI